MKKKNWELVLSLTILIVASVGLMLNLDPSAYVVLASDSLGNDIVSIEVHQWNGTDYVLRVNFTTTGGSVSVEDSDKIKFVVQIKLNNSLASSTTEAINYTQIKMNITQTSQGDIWNNEILNNTSCSQVGDFYYVFEEGIWDETGKPEAGITYTCNTRYEAYY